MPAAVRVLIQPAEDPQTVRLLLAFAAPERGERLAPAHVGIDFGDGQTADLGLIVPPTAATWPAQRVRRLADHTYQGLGPYTVRLIWQAHLLEIQVAPGRDRAGPEDAEAQAPVVETFSVENSDGRPLERNVKIKLQGLRPGEHVRLDSGAGQAWWLDEPPTTAGPWERRLAYAKSGFYTLSLDLVDSDGFLLRRLAEQPVEVIAWRAEGPRLAAQASSATGQAPILVGDQPASEAGQGETTSRRPPWQPFRYARPLWGWVRTYTSPGGAAVARVLALGAYLSLHDEMLVGSTLWYQTAGRDWIQAGALDFLYPSQSRGIACAVRQPEAEAAPQHRRGTVMAGLLNVRRRPGIRADNPPVSQLTAGTEVTINQEALYGGATWFGLGTMGWVYGDCVRLARPGAGSDALAQPVGLPIGWVTAPALNVRARPGSDPDTPPIAVLAKNQAVTIMDTHIRGSQVWHAVGAGRWVEGSWLRLARPTARPSTIPAHARWVAISLAEQTAVAYEGDSPVYAMLISTGLHATPTPDGLFHIYRRQEAARIAGGNPAWGSYYDLEDVPWVNYFHSGYALLGAYWHDDFGRPHSHGCVNLSLYDAWWLYHWSAEGDLALYIY